MSLDGFIDKAVRKYGDKFDYSRVEFLGNNKKVAISCREHGSFMQTPASHLVSKTGCPKCGRGIALQRAMKRLGSQKHFTERVKAVHGDKYDLSEAVYSGSKTKVTVVCRDHGKFYSTPFNLYKGRGCPKCSGRIVTQDEFISKAVEVHGNRYEYEKSVYKGADKRVVVGCKVHGEFSILARAHTINGSGCPQCARDEVSEKFRMKTPEFISKAKAVWGEIFDYSKTKCGRNQKDKITVVCRSHGGFVTSTSGHLQGSGCPICCESRGERSIARCLKKTGVVFEREKRFEDCRSKNPLPFDFWLPENNAVIEFDGRQHFTDTGWGSPLDRGILKRDLIKTEYARSRGIRMLRIPYWRIKDIPEILGDFVNATAGNNTLGQG